MSCIIIMVLGCYLVGMTCELCVWGVESLTRCDALDLNIPQGPVCKAQPQLAELLGA